MLPWVRSYHARIVQVARVEGQLTACESVRSVPDLLLPVGPARVGRALARDVRGFDPCRQRPRGVAVDFGPKQSGWLINQRDNPSFAWQTRPGNRIRQAACQARREGCSLHVSHWQWALAAGETQRQHSQGREQLVTAM
jgi:hypothetical protein